MSIIGHAQHQTKVLEKNLNEIYDILRQINKKIKHREIDEDAIKKELSIIHNTLALGRVTEALNHAKNLGHRCL